MEKLNGLATELVLIKVMVFEPIVLINSMVICIIRVAGVKFSKKASILDAVWIVL